MNERRDDIRCFLAVPLSSQLLGALEGLQAEARQTLRHLDVKWVPPQNIHLTFHFFGAIPQGIVPDIERALTLVLDRASAIPFRVVGLGAFPGPARPRVIWAGIEDEPRGALAAAQQRIDESLAELGLPCEERAFRPHLTIGRVREHLVSGRRSGGPVDLTSYRGRLVGHGVAEELDLIQSRLTPDGARYEVLRRVQFRGTAGNAGAPQNEERAPYPPRRSEHVG